IAVLTNAESGEVLHREVTRWALQTFLGAAEPEPAIVPLDRESLDAYVGRYHGALGDLDVTAVDDSLTIRGIPPNGDPPSRSIRLGCVGPDRFIALDSRETGQRVEFLRDKVGTIEWLRWGGRLHRRLPS